MAYIYVGIVLERWLKNLDLKSTVKMANKNKQIADAYKKIGLAYEVLSSNAHLLTEINEMEGGR